MGLLPAMNEPRHRLPQLSDAELDNLPQAWADYARRLSRGIHEMSKADIQAVKDLDRPPLFVGALTATQSVTADTLTTVTLMSSVDTHGFWDASAYSYTPKVPGYYRCAWALNGRDEGGVAASTYCYAQLDAGAVSYQSIAYGAGKDAWSSGSAIVLCDGSTDAIVLRGLMLTGTTTFFYLSTANRTWLTIDYLGRR